MIIAILVWLVLAIVVGAAASGRGRSGAGWFVLAVLLSPLIAGLIVAVLPDLKTRALLENIGGAAGVEDFVLDRPPPKPAWRVALDVVATLVGLLIVGWLLSLFAK